MGAVFPKRTPQHIPALRTALALAHLAEPAGEPYLLHGHVIWENFIVKKELYLEGRWGAVLGTPLSCRSRTTLGLYGLFQLPLSLSLPPKNRLWEYSRAGDLTLSGDIGPSGDDELQL